MSGSAEALPACFELVRGYLPRIDLAEILALTWDQPTIKVFGREHKIPRLTRWFGEAGYTYSGAANAPEPMPIWLDGRAPDVPALRGEVGPARGWGEVTSFRAALRAAGFKVRRPGPKQYAAHGLTGCVQQRRARSTGLLVGVYQSAQSGIESDPDLPWVTVCEEHGSCVCHKTLADAKGWASVPEQWCEACRGGTEEPG